MEYAAYGDTFVPVDMMSTWDYGIKDVEKYPS
jgi:hypothetical protein